MQVIFLNGRHSAQRRRREPSEGSVSLSENEDMLAMGVYLIRTRAFQEKETA